jgi:hypothetical protein
LPDTIHLYEEIYLSAHWRVAAVGLLAKANNGDKSSCGKKRDSYNGRKSTFSHQEREDEGEYYYFA